MKFAQPNDRFHRYISRSIAEMFTVAKQIGAAQTSVLPLLAAGVFYYIFNLVVASFMEYLEKKTSYYR